jgi:hypothetical protein
MSWTNVGNQRGHGGHGVSKKWTLKSWIVRKTASQRLTPDFDTHPFNWDRRWQGKRQGLLLNYHGAYLHKVLYYLPMLCSTPVLQHSSTPVAQVLSPKFLTRYDIQGRMGNGSRELQTFSYMSGFAHVLSQLQS